MIPKECLFTKLSYRKQVQKIVSQGSQSSQSSEIIRGGEVLELGGAHLHEGKLEALA